MKTRVVDKANWARVESLFEQAIQTPNSERDAFLISQCGENQQLLDEVRSLVACHDRVERPEVAASFTQGIASEFQQLADQIKRQTTRAITPNHSHLAPKPARSVNDLREALQQRHPDFEVIDVISQGGTGAVFRVNQKSLAREVAVKVLLTTELDERVRQRFIRESIATAKVKHDNVVDIYSVHDDADLPLLVMEFVDGPSLKSYVESEQQLSPHLAAEIAGQIAGGLQAAHEQELVHRDVKPANVILETSANDGTDEMQYRAKLIDFGIVRDLASDGATLDQLIVGTPSFMSPEQLFSPQEVDHRCDIYGLGITLYFMLTGTLPFQGAPHMVMRQVDSADPTPPRTLDDRIPKDLESICLKAIHKIPAKRYATRRGNAAGFEPVP